MTVTSPKVFISYSWDSIEHKEWVKELANKLLDNGIDVTIDQYDLELGDRLPQFMETQIRASDYILIICTEKYKQKADARTNGVGYESHIISGELFSNNNDRKFIPIVRSEHVSEVLPTFLQGKMAINLGNNTEEDFQDLLTTLFGINKKPLLKDVPNDIISNKIKYGSNSDTTEDIQILGIIADEVTIPKLDGTVGSALYKIPLRLNRKPSELWEQLFLENWKYPPKFTTMHRSKIAKIINDKIILDGTTIEEVKEYHRDTLKLCVELSNNQEKDHIRKQMLEEERKLQKIQNHMNSVKQISDEIIF
ncbi:toll/interleukin-1 receptor domain-containing protein [Streptococcus uberis]|uniref:TIR domain-containing protein n=2 Tax=Streptococcus uberis TaxID=1349 RepID=A0A6L6GAH7_STRUB|nr:toll/interleukin-1 receptor domain-containing protein [Streptococcus uberis]MCK1236787.1 toll/interleukin-1 receptor domain-containing protein [Streptococcus uberis]MTB98500.1 TIR domain-containing protein [Streptococcus uberis]MTC87240.1 TIR domain-containing protein [Streptococcus uberis]MTD02465.1 TIR domain-containing protein [Streptococcus uberis]